LKILFPIDLAADRMMLPIRQHGMFQKCQIWWRIYLLIFGAAAFSACSTSATVVRAESASLEQVEQALDEGDFALATRGFSNLPADEAAGIEALNLLARMHDVTRRQGALEDVVLQMLVIDPANPYGLEQMGLIRLAEGDLVSAENYLTQAVTVDPSRWMAWNGLGVIADSRTAFDDAQQNFSRALEIVPGHPKVLANLGWSKLLEGEYEQAETTFRKSLLVNPDSIVTQSNLAFCIALQGRYGEALTLYGKLYDPSVAANNVGYAAMVREDQPAAKKYFARALELKPNYYRKAANNLASVGR